MKGGIQPGMVAMDKEAKGLDALVRKASKEIYAKLVKKYPQLERQYKLFQKQIPGNQGGCQPDGGAFFYKGILIAAFEGKKQQNKGNAIERWFKNNYTCRSINPDMSYVTFCSGEGAYKNKMIGKILSVAHYPHGFNRYIPGGNSTYLQPLGFTYKKIATIIEEVLCERICQIDQQK